MSASIGKIYAQALTQISINQQDLLNKSIRLLLCQKDGTLSAAGLGIGLAQVLHMTIAINDLLHLSNGLIILDTDLGSLRFADTSIREYFNTHEDFSPAENDAFVASCCLRYLCRDVVVDRSLLDNGEVSNNRFIDDLHQYACLYWPFHLCKSKELRLQPPLCDLCNPFLKDGMNPSPAFNSWSNDAEIGVYGGDGFLEDWSGEHGSSVWDTLGHPPDPLFVAVAWGFDEMVTKRLDHHPDSIHARSYEFNSPLLCIAASRGRETTTRILLDRGADVQARDGFGDTALIIAMRAKNLAIVQVLLEHDAAADQPEGGRMNKSTALHQAAEDGQTSIVRLMLEYHPDVEAKNEEGMTPLEIAIEAGHSDVAMILLDHTSSTEQSYKDTCLLAAQIHRTVGAEDIHTLESLLDRWPGTPEISHFLGRALWKAAQTDCISVTELLLRKGADPNMIHHGSSVMYAVGIRYESDEEQYSMLKLLLRHGAKVDAPSEYGSRLLLCYACRQGMTGLVLFLVENGADVNLCASDGPTPLYEAVYSDEEEIAALLLENGADPNFIGHPRARGDGVYKPEDCTVLDVAIERSLESVEKLLRKHAAVTRRTVLAASAA